MDAADLLVDPLDARLVGDRFAQVGESAAHVLDLPGDAGGQIAAQLFAQPDQFGPQFLDGRAFGVNAIVGLAPFEGRRPRSRGTAAVRVILSSVDGGLHGRKRQ